MKCNVQRSHERPSTWDTLNQSPSEFSAAELVEPGTGCLLQIYPATPNAELIRVSQDRTIIGRGSECDITIDDQSMSRTHAAIDSTETGYFLTDLNSTNGTYLNDELLQTRVLLTGGELIRIGRSILKFMSSANEEANYHAVVHELMTRDSLTNTFNRSYLMSLIEKELDRCRHQDCHFSIILLDIDHFKQINDRHGHLVGDEVLQTFCERLRQSLRRFDRLSRFGGEEFVVSCSETELEDAGRIAERLRLSVSSQPFLTQAGPISVTCSLGVASSNGRDFATCDQLVRAADRQLYSAKQAGRNRVQVSDPTATRIS